MFDNLRDQAQSSPFYEEEAKFQPAAGTAEAAARPSSARFLGLTAPQRLILSVMLMVAVCVLGTMAMLITGRFVIY
jgi:hypothetical protein